MEKKAVNKAVRTLVAATALTILGCGAADEAGEANVPSIDIGAAATDRPIERDPGGAGDLPGGFCRRARTFCPDPKKGGEWCMAADGCDQ